MYPGFTIAHCRASEYPVNVQVLRSGRIVGLVDVGACPTASEEAVAEWAAPWWNRRPGMSGVCCGNWARTSPKLHSRRGEAPMGTHRRQQRVPDRDGSALELPARTQRWSRVERMKLQCVCIYINHRRFGAHPRPWPYTGRGYRLSRCSRPWRRAVAGTCRPAGRAARGTMAGSGA